MLKNYYDRVNRNTFRTHLSLILLLTVSLGCQFKNYEDSLLQKFEQYQISDILGESQTNLNVRGFGFWSFSIPLITNIKTQSIFGSFQTSQKQDGQLLFVIENLELQNIFSVGYQSFDYKTREVIHIINTYNNNQIKKTFQIRFPALLYEGKWIFHLITFEIDKKKGESFYVQTTQSAKSFNGSNKQYRYKIYLGGSSYLMSLNLNFFKGRLSKIIQIQNSQTFNQLIKKCSIPPKFQGELTIQIVDGFRSFNGKSTLENIFEYNGPNYYISGWVKYKSINLKKDYYTLLRLSGFQNYESRQKLGDDLFVFEVELINNIRSNSKITITSDAYNIPYAQSFQEQYDSTFQNGVNTQYAVYQTQNIIQNTENDDIYNGLTHWHFLKYEFLGTQETNKMHLILYFFNEVGRKELFLGNTIFQGSFTNVFIYSVFGGDKFNNNYFQGEISNFTISYQYQTSKILNDTLICDKTCSTCAGPKNTDCLSCFNNQNRFYQQEQKICQCIAGYFESENYLCEDLSKNFPSLMFDNIKFEHPEYCKFGEYRLPNSDDSYECKPCPKQMEDNGLSCIDCVLQSKTWYLKPVCKRDLIRLKTNDNVPYFIQQRDQLLYDAYLIGDQRDLQIQPDFEDFCDWYGDNCFETSLIHLGRQVSMLCKNNLFVDYEIWACAPYYDKLCTTISYPVEQYCYMCFPGYYTIGQHCMNCPSPCTYCQFNFQTSLLECSQCIDGYASLNKQCIQCGQNCAICLTQFNEISQQFYIRCLKCNDDTKYFIGLEGVDCKFKLIMNCLYSFETISYDYSINTLDRNFQIQQNTTYFVEICAMCKQGFLFIFQEYKCVEFQTFQCDFGIGQLNTLKNQYDLKECLMASDEQPHISEIQFSKDCNLYNQNCISCLQTDLIHEYICLECTYGYYASKIKGNCIECPQDLFCDKCIQQEKQFETNWKINTRAFYRKYIENIDGHSFTKYAQSQDENDYIVQCLICKEGYQLQNNLCIKYCFSDCAECILYDGQYHCIKCHSIKETYSPLFIENNKCIECSENCKLCIPRTQEEINSINPTFNSEIFRKYSHHCLIPMKSENVLYDEEFGIFIDCDKIENENCQKQVIIELYLFSNLKEQQNKLNSISDPISRKNFELQCLQADDLFNGTNSFPKFQNNKFYQFGNLLQISKIVFKIFSLTKRVFDQQYNMTIQQRLSENIFTLKDIELEIFFNSKNTYQFSYSIFVKNFTKIRMERLNGREDQQIYFQSQYEQEIYFKYLLCSQIHLTNLKTLEVDNMKFTSQYKQYSNVFEIESKSNNFQATFSNIQVLNNYFENINIFSFAINSNASIQFFNLSISASFISGHLIKFYDSIKYLHMDGIQLLQNEFNFIEDFLDLSKVQNTVINNLTVVNNKIKTSTLIKIYNFVNFSNIQISQNILIGASKIFYNTNSSSITFNATMKNILFSDISYDTLVKFIVFSRIQSTFSSLDIDNITLQNNFLSNLSLTYDQYDEQSSLILIEINDVKIYNYRIERGPGIIDFYFRDVRNLLLFQGLITQTKYQFKGLHEDLNCQLDRSNGTFYPSSIFIFSLKTLKVENLVISKVQIYNFAIIAYYSSLLNEKNHLQTLLFSNLMVKENSLLQTQSVSILGLFSLLCYHQTKISFTNTTFSQNIFHMYEQSLEENSAGVITINGQQNFIIIESTIFQENMVTNGSNSILLLSGQELTISNCQFHKNNIFNYETFQPNLIWGFEDLENVYTETIENIFQIKPLAGNGILKVNNILMNNNIFNQTQGEKGGCFYIQTQLQTSIQIYNCQFYNTRSLFQKQTENGGVFYIESMSTQQLEFKIKNITANQIYCSSQGGFIYLITLSSNVIISFDNVTFTDIYAQIGSILFTSFQSYSSMNTQLYAGLLSFQNSQQGYQQFLNYYKLNLNQASLNNLMNNRTLIFVENCEFINLQNSIIFGLVYESLLNSKNSTKFVLSRIKIYNSTSVNNLIQFAPSESIAYLYQLDRNSNIYFNRLHIENITLGFKLEKQICTIPEQNLILSKFICLVEQIEAPKYLETYSSGSENNFAECTLIQMFQQLDISQSGLLQFIELNLNTEIKLNDLNLNAVDCDICRSGLIFITFSVYSQLELLQKIQKLSIRDSFCGKFGCLMISRISTNLENQSSGAIYKIENFYELIIKNFICLQNTGTFGTCLYLQNIQTLIIDGYCSGNKAKQIGGAIFIEGKGKLVIENTIIEMNSALIGGGVYLKHQSPLEFQKLETFIIKNTASYFGKNLVSLPISLTLVISEKQLEKTLYRNNKEETIEQIVLKKYQSLEGQWIDFIMIPTGQIIGQYQYFDQKNRIYINTNLSLSLIALGKDLEVIKDLEGTNCSIKSRQIQNDNLEQEFTNNYTKSSQILYDINTQSYNLNDLIVYFESNISSSYYLQLEFTCASIQIPIYSTEYPYQIEQTHQNYKLLANFKTYQCQYGEIKNLTNFACEKCDSTLGMYSLILNQQKCNVIDEFSTISILNNQLNLRPFYWRPYFSTSDISYCLNLPTNCLGGEIEGDNSCYFGHVGALCEQCDLYDIRGNGRFSNLDRFSCSPCSSDQSRNVIIIAATVIFTFIFLLISVSGILNQIKFIANNYTKENNKFTFLFRIALTQLTTNTQSSILMKMLTNYLQIVASITTFQLQFSTGILSTLNVIGNPIESATYSLDCFLTEIFTCEIQYGRMIWQIIVPFIYIFIFLIVFILVTKLKLISFDFSVVTTTLIYLYIYFQPNLIGGLIQLLSYRQISGFKWIQANVAGRYDTFEHLQWIIKFCLPMGFILTIFIPVFLFIGLFKNRFKLDQKEARANWGFLYKEYKIDAYYWELIKILQKTLIILSLNFYQDLIVIKGILVLFITYLYQELNINYQPYYLYSLNKLDYYSANVCMITFSLAVGAYFSQVTNIVELKIPFLVFIVILNFLFVQLILRKIIKEYLRSFEPILDKVRDKIRQKFPSWNKGCFGKYLKNRTLQRQKVQARYQRVKMILMPMVKSAVEARQHLIHRVKQNQESKIFLSDENASINIQVHQSQKKKE